MPLADYKNSELQKPKFVRQVIDNLGTGGRLVGTKKGQFRKAGALLEVTSPVSLVLYKTQ